MLTKGSIGAKAGRRWELDGRGGTSVRATMVAGGRGLDSAGVGFVRAREGMEELRGEAREALARGIDEGRRGVTGAGMLHSGLLRLVFHSLRARGRRSVEENGHGSVGIRTGARARRARFADGRRVASPAMTRGRGMGARTTSLENTVTE